VPISALGEPGAQPGSQRPLWSLLKSVVSTLHLSSVSPPFLILFPPFILQDCRLKVAANHHLSVDQLSCGIYSVVVVIDFATVFALPVLGRDTSRLSSYTTTPYHIRPQTTRRRACHLLVSPVPKLGCCDKFSALFVYWQYELDNPSKKSTAEKLLVEGKTIVNIGSSVPRSSSC